MTDAAHATYLSPEVTPAAAPEEAPVASVTDLSVSFRRPDGSAFRVVDGVSLTVHRGEVVGIVGESGSGKSMTARSMMRLTPKGGEIGGSVRVEGQEILGMTDKALRDLRGTRVAMVFQDPMTSFNPVRSIGDQIGEAVTIHERKPASALRRHIVRLLEQVGIVNAERRADAYPHEFSGGMRQRALIAMSVANAPSLLIADEPTTALDVTVQDQVLDLMRDLNQQSGTSIILITHNIAVVASICTRVVVMYAGRAVEDGPVDEILSNPQHPYTWMLLQSVPRIDRETDRLVAIDGQPPDPAAMPKGCKFHTRCPFAFDRCRQEEPELSEIGEGHSARCFLRMDAIDEEERARV